MLVSDLLDIGRGGIEQLVGQARQGPRHRELVADLGDLGVPRIPAGGTPADELRLVIRSSSCSSMKISTLQCLLATMMLTPPIDERLVTIFRARRDPHQGRPVHLTGNFCSGAR